LDGTVLEKLKNKYDGKYNIIGCEKVHIRAHYEQLLATANYSTFDSLSDEYNQQLSYFKVEHPLLAIHAVNKLVRRENRTFIYANSPNREDFIQPMRIISHLFTPKLIKLEYSECRFLNKMTKGA
jgi:hypothetical protein